MTDLERANNLERELRSGDLLLTNYDATIGANPSTPGPYRLSFLIAKLFGRYAVLWPVAFHRTSILRTGT